MSLRVMEIVVPGEDLAGLRETLEKQSVVDLWIEELSSGLGRARVLLPTEKTENVMDLLDERYGGKSGFRVMLLSVEATIPELPEKQDDKASPPASPPVSKSRDVNRVSREELYQDITDGARLSKVFLITVALSTLVAAIGLIRGDVAIIIGAMVIAPLLGPNVALALGATLGDMPLITSSLRTLAAGVLVTIALSVIFGLAVPPDATSPESLSRTNLDVFDILLAMAAGSAGALAFTSSLPAALIGVMVAVALLPPLVTAGLLLGAGQSSLAVRAIALFVTNVACVNLAGVITFLAQRIRPRGWWEEKRARKAVRLAIAFWLAVIVVLIALIVFFWHR